MKQLFIGGMITGALLLYLILSAISIRTESSEEEQLRQQLNETISGKQNQETEVQYVEVKVKKRNVTLHTGMSKDSVRILVGKPDEFTLYAIGSSTHESWGYKLKNKNVSDLDIKFVDGKLEGVRQD